jgi:hypothetical protein
MSARWWNELVADLSDHVPGGTAGLAGLLLLLAGIVAFALLFGRQLLGWRPLRTGGRPAELPVEETDDTEVPELPPEQLRSLADRYAAAGRYAEAVRERLRAMVRELVEAGVIEHRPGWTVTELATAAGTALPTARAALTAAAHIFSDIWYGKFPAVLEHDMRMRDLEDQVRALCAELPAHNGSGAAVPVEAVGGEP